MRVAAGYAILILFFLALFCVIGKIASWKDAILIFLVTGAASGLLLFAAWLIEGGLR